MTKKSRNSGTRGRGMEGGCHGIIRITQNRTETRSERERVIPMFSHPTFPTPSPSSPSSLHSPSTSSSSFAISACRIASSSAYKMCSNQTHASTTCGTAILTHRGALSSVSHNISSARKNWPDKINVLD